MGDGPRRLRRRRWRIGGGGNGRRAVHRDSEYARDNELRRQREHREQAEHFTVWVAEVGTRVAEVVGTSPGTPFITVGLINASSGVLSDLRFQITCVPDINVREDLRPYVRIENEAHAYLPVLPPGPARTVDIELPGESTGMVDSADVYFYDQRNVKWRRDLVTGHLSESSARPFIVELSEDGPGDPLEEDGFITVQWLGPAVGLAGSRRQLAETSPFVARPGGSGPYGVDRTGKPGPVYTHDRTARVPRGRPSLARPVVDRSPTMTVARPSRQVLRRSLRSSDRQGLRSGTACTADVYVPQLR